MNRSIKKVVLAGATGTLGSLILSILSQSVEFEVTVVVRRTNATFPSRVTVKVADFNSVSSLTEAFEDQDAVIDATSGSDPGVNIRIIDAAVRARVYRIIPAEFSVDPENAKARSMPVFQGKDKAFHHVQELASEDKITYTTISNGAFMDWCLRTGFLSLDIHSKKVELMNGGTLVIPWTLLESVAKATVEVLRLKDAKNRSFFIYSVQKSQKEMADLAKEALGPEGWETTTIDMEKVIEGAMMECKAGNFNVQVIGDMIRYINSTEGYSGAWKNDDNEVLGVPTMSDEEVRQLITKIAREKK
ncbi:hypothetical protein B0J11DRAFT_592605 [Dendryphion nanum]|uniref:NAD(P)-binding domain-containing protein n=1 Tax=Dendryphion nanum TaxID=256645 RepID=A0A9P9IDU3_9PLEO|nr:hypothetical protein B0J11DRAFT_592605 [Dendryphion nanum]